MFASVLAPIDLNHEESWTKALPMARRMTAEGGELHLLAVLPDFGTAMVGSFFPKNFEQEALAEVRKSLTDFAAKEAPEAKIHVGHGHIAEAILKAAKQSSAELIVMASHPPDELRSLLIGSNAAKVVRHAPISVLVVR